MEKDNSDWIYIASEIWATILKQLRAADLFHLRSVCRFLKDFVDAYINDRRLLQVYTRTNGPPEHVFVSSSIEEIYLLLAGSFGRQKDYFLIDCTTMQLELGDLLENKTYFVSRLNSLSLVSKDEEWRIKVLDIVQKRFHDDPSLGLSYRTTLQALYALKIIKESEVITLNYKSTAFVGRISSKDDQVVIHTSFMPGASSTTFPSFNAFIMAATGRRGSIGMYNKLHIGARSYQQVQQDYRSTIQQRVSERLKQAEALEFITTPRGVVEPSPTPLTIKEQVLNSFITAGINEQAAEEFLSRCEEALPMDSNRNWILRFIDERHEDICDTKQDLLTNTVEYFKALGFDRTPSMDPEICKYEPLINIAHFLVYDALLTITCPLLGAGVPLDTWTMVQSNSKANTNGALPTEIAVFVTNDADKVMQSDVQAQLKNIKHLPDDAEFWYHATSRKNATAIASTGIKLLGGHTDFNRGPSFYLNRHLHGEMGALHWCWKLFGTGACSVILIYAIRPQLWQDDTNLELKDSIIDNNWQKFVKYCRNEALPSKFKPSNYDSATVEGHICTNGNAVAQQGTGPHADWDSWQLCLRTDERAELFDAHLVGAIVVTLNSAPKSPVITVTAQTEEPNNNNTNPMITRGIQLNQTRTLMRIIS